MHRPILKVLTYQLLDKEVKEGGRTLRQGLFPSGGSAIPCIDPSLIVLKSLRNQSAARRAALTCSSVTVDGSVAERWLCHKSMISAT